MDAAEVVLLATFQIGVHSPFFQDKGKCKDNYS